MGSPFSVTPYINTIIEIYRSERENEEVTSVLFELGSLVVNFNN